MLTAAVSVLVLLAWLRFVRPVTAPAETLSEAPVPEPEVHVSAPRGGVATVSMPRACAACGDVSNSKAGAPCVRCSPTLDQTEDELTGGTALPSLPANLEPIPLDCSLVNDPAFNKKYKLVGTIGSGAMGIVLLGHHIGLDRTVAIKLVKSENFSPAEVRRLQKEARTLARLSHPGVVMVFDVETVEGTPYMVCEYVEGRTLGDRMHAQPPLSIVEALRIIRQVLDALQAAHIKGIVHRDLKPGNIFLTKDGKPKIGDFGLAKSQTYTAGTSVGTILGTPRYMSPEQCNGQGTTEASDLYAVGVILFEMVVGRTPFEGPQLLDFLTQHTKAPVPSARKLKPEIPRRLNAILQQALAKNPKERFKDARAFRRKIKKLLDELAPPKRKS